MYRSLGFILIVFSVLFILVLLFQHFYLSIIAENLFYDLTNIILNECLFK